jgi:hypothetical protein
VLTGVLLSPIVLTFFYMAPGPFPPVLYNIDTAYFLEKVHALVVTDAYPPASLSNVGIRRTYHYATQGMAALISRSSGLLPHHAVFMVVLPLLTAGAVAAAAATRRHLAGGLPLTVTLPLLLIATPSLGNSFWGKFGAQLWAAATSPGASIDAIVGDYAMWGFLSNEGQNIGGDFVILASIAGIVAARQWGWWLAVFLIGGAVLVKIPVGIALLAGFMLAHVWCAAIGKRVWLSSPVVLAGGLFAAMYVAFFAISFESEYRVEAAPLAHVREIAGKSGLLLAGVDLLWLFLPALIVISARIYDPTKSGTPLALMAFAPILVVNATRLENISTGGGGTGGDWVQILHPVPFLLHAFALALAGRRWSQLGRGRRAAFLIALALTVLPVAGAASRYSLLLLRNPESGNEYVDNRPLAAALAVVPRTGSIIVTNDLRYPAGNFTRDDRQMQIPALFGHQAFAVNYAHEAVAERRGLQRLLQQPEWSDAIDEAARTHGWTHLLIRKDYMHPAPVPLELLVENQDYAVFRFP